MYYPKECYSINEPVTRQRKKDYETAQNRLVNTCLHLCPNYYKLGLKSRLAIKDKAKAILGM